MKTREVHRVGRFWFATTQRPDGQWVAWAQTTPIYADAPLTESVERVWLASGSSREQAAAKLKQQLALPPYDTASIQQRHRCWIMLLTATGMTLGGMIVAEPTLFFGGMIGIGHGLYACVWLSERSDSRSV